MSERICDHRSKPYRTFEFQCAAVSAWQHFGSMWGRLYKEMTKKKSDFWLQKRFLTNKKSSSGDQAIATVPVFAV